MPEGHSVHRIARQFRANFVGTRPEITSPQGRFSEGAALLSGSQMLDALAVGKQMFLQFEHERWLRVHLGIYGAWDFSGELRIDEKLRQGRYASTRSSVKPIDAEGEDSFTSIGAPRLQRMRIAEQTSASSTNSFPPEPRGQVRVRLLNDMVCADLRGPTACEVLTTGEVEITMNRLGPDPENLNTPEELQRFMQRMLATSRPIAVTLMDQSIIAGIGNVYRAELLFRSRIDPFTPSNTLPTDVIEALWHDWAYLLHEGISEGQMITIDGLSDAQYVRAVKTRKHRHWVYKREGEPCRVCATRITLTTIANRKLYWCASCQS